MLINAQGRAYEFQPLNESYKPGPELHLDIGFVFLKKQVSQDKKKWHFPCIQVPSIESIDGLL